MYVHVDGNKGYYEANRPCFKAVNDKRYEKACKQYMKSLNLHKGA